MQAIDRKEPTEFTTPERLLDAAEELFAEKGFGSTSVRDITNLAGTNLASVNYHFGGKQNLYASVFQRMLEVLREHRIAGLKKVIHQPGADLKAILQTFSRVFLEPLVEGSRGPRMMQLFMREMVEPRLPRGMIVSELLEPISLAFREALSRECPGLGDEEARLCMISIMGQLIHVLLTFQMYRDAGRAEFPVKDIQQVIDHVVQFAAAGVRECAAGNPGEEG